MARIAPVVGRLFPVVTALLIVSNTATAGVLSVSTVQPARHALNALPTGSISVTFDAAVDPASINAGSFWAFGKWSGTVSGTYSFSNGDQTVTLNPDADLFFGEQVMVILSHDIQTPGGTTLRSAGYSWQYWNAAAPATRNFTFLDSMTTRTTPAQGSRAYGGIATDLNNDGWADITVVNEDTADLRVFMNQANGTGKYDPFLQPTFPINTQASPSEPGDFNHDGFADICVANISTASVSILLGNGDGTYAPQQEISVGTQPRGIAVLDADGDGDMDIVNTNSGSSTMSVLINNGSGVFGAPTFFEGGGAGEWALAAADMTDDGILDLVVGARNSQTIIVNRGNGDATFTPLVPQAAGGAVWMLVFGDVNGDGNEDVATANSSQSNGAILFGDGAGGLAPPVTRPTDPFPLATDLGDLDGDGDLDWLTSSFNGDWFVFTNNGSGLFTFDQEMLAPDAASCAVLVDIDNDGDLDLVLIDELEDVVILQLNDGTAIPGDLDGDGTVGINDFLDLLALWGPCPSCPPFCTGDVDFDCEVGINDFLTLLANWT
jgi:hypothetical protein